MTTAAAAMEGMPERAQAFEFEVARPPGQSRITNFPLFIGTFIRVILLIPHFVILYFLQIVANILYLIATFAILFTGRFPGGLFNFVLGYLRWNANVYGYVGHLYDAYPPFNLQQQEAFPLQFRVEAPESSSRLLNFPFLGFIIKFVLLIPHLIVLSFLYLVALILIFIAQFAILFTGAFPEGMHKFVVGVGRWYNRVEVYLLALSDKYPPFSMS